MGEEVEEFWADNDNVAIIDFLDDIGQPYSCSQWGSIGNPNLPIIINDGASYNFHDQFSNIYATNVFIDHEMRVHYKEAGYNSNTFLQVASETIDEMLYNMENSLILYHEVFFTVDDLSDDLKHIFFDMCVNQGKSRAVKILQQAANNKNLNWSKSIKVDGGLGPNTRKAISKLEHTRVQAFRVKYYAEVMVRKPDLAKFYFGWYRRAIAV